MSDYNYMMLACPTLRREITVAMEEEGMRYPVFYLPNELHHDPDSLNEWLCDFISRLVNIDYLLLPMGLCGNGTQGVPSGNTTLVLPKSQDCISLLLSHEHLSDVERPVYDYFFTESWLGEKRSFDSEHSYTVQKYGKETAATIMKMMYQNYKYFSYIDTGYGNYEEAASKIRGLADLVGVEIRRLEGSFGVLRKMIKLDFDDDFLKVSPGQVVAFDQDLV